MRIYSTKADSNGKFKIGAGHGFLVVPRDAGAVFPIEAHFNGQVTPAELIEEARPLYPQPYTSVEFWGAAANSEWLVYHAERDGETIGPATYAEKMVRLHATYETDDSQPQLAPGTYYLPDFSTTTQTIYDARRFSGVLLTFHIDNIAVVSGTPVAKLYLDGYAQNNATHGNFEAFAAGTVNELATGVVSWVQLGQGFSASSGDRYAVYSTRFPYVSPRLVVSGGTLQLDGFNFLDLWGIY